MLFLHARLQQCDYSTSSHLPAHYLFAHRLRLGGHKAIFAWHGIAYELIRCHFYWFISSINGRRKRRREENSASMYYLLLLLYCFCFFFCCCRHEWRCRCQFMPYRWALIWHISLIIWPRLLNYYTYAVLVFVIVVVCLFTHQAKKVLSFVNTSLYVQMFVGWVKLCWSNFFLISFF